MTTDTSKQTQCSTLLKHLKRRKITQAEAQELYGIARLASRINDLRNQGHAIQRQMIDVYNRYGEKCRVAEYWMER